ncbi:hypothetical protein ACJQWK_05039 [Exserohilum turcicum]
MAGFNPEIPGLHDLDAEYIAYTNAPTLLMQIGTLFGATALVISLRCYVRIAMIRSFGKDDWTILLAFAFALASFIIYVMLARIGLGKHLPVIRMNEEGYREFSKLRQVLSITVGVGIGLVKISVAFFLLRLVTKKAYKWFLRGFIVFMLLFTVGCTGALAVTIATDFLLALLPVPLVWKLQLNGRSKVTLVCILALGLFAGVAAIIKSEKQKTIFSNPDPYVKDTFVMWRFIEYFIGIIAASLPSLKPLFKQLLSNGTRATEEASSQPLPSRQRYSTRIKTVEDDEIPLEIYGKIGHSVEVSSGCCKVQGEGEDRGDSVRTLEPNTILVEEKWRVS